MLFQVEKCKSKISARVNPQQPTISNFGSFELHDEYDGKGTSTFVRITGFIIKRKESSRWTRKGC